VNIRAVAARAGVSIATVSRVMAGSSLVRPETAASVRKIIDELQYVPNTSATTLKYGRSDTYGVIIPDLTNPFFLEFLREIEALLINKGQATMLANTEGHDRSETSVKRLMMSQIDGAVVMAAEEEVGNYNLLALRKIPLVTVDRRSTGPRISDVSFCYEDGMRQAIAHLAKLGHKDIGFIGGHELGTAKTRYRAFESALKKRGLRPREEWHRHGDFRVDGGDREMRQLLQLKHHPTAVVCINDLTAFGAIRAARALGIVVPDDMSVVGVDDIMLADIVTPPLTTVRMPRQQLARCCVEAFETMAKHPEAKGVQMWVQLELIIRSSTAPPRPNSKRKKQKK
jgi:DNA-binding LacI/PurR family transcriptional regulator